MVAPRVRGGEFGMPNRRQFVRSGVALAAAVGFAPRLSALAQSDAATPAAATPVVPTDISTLPLKKAGQLTIHADQAGLPAILHRRRPEQRQGLRVGARLRRRRTAGLHQGPDRLGLHVVQRLVRAGPEGFRLLHHAGQHHRGAEAGGRLQRPVLHVAIGRRDQAGFPGARGEDPRRAGEVQLRRPGGHAPTTPPSPTTSNRRRKRSSSTPRPIR